VGLKGTPEQPFYEAVKPVMTDPSLAAALTLPGATFAPAREWTYFVSFTARGERPYRAMVWGNAAMETDGPIRSYDDVLNLTRRLETTYYLDGATIISWAMLPDPGQGAAIRNAT
jgi:hypothetical protein